MSNGIIDVRQSELNDIQNALNKSISNIDGFSTKFSPSFKNATSVGLLNKSTNMIQKQMSTINTQVLRMNKTISNMYDNMASLENELARKADDIQTPVDFCTNDTASSISINKGNLSKEDGRAVKDTDDKDVNDLDFENAIEYNDKLKYIVKEYENKNGEVEIQGNLINLQNVKKDQVVIDSSIDEYSIKEEILTKINKEINEEFPDLNDSFEIESIYLEALKNQNTEQVNYDDLYLDIKKEILRRLNNGNYILKNNKE